MNHAGDNWIRDEKLPTSGVLEKPGPVSAAAAAAISEQETCLCFGFIPHVYV